jgi:uncharacterized protein (TIGR03067 family)
MKPTVLLILSAGLLIAADDPNAPAAKERKKLEGTWTLVSSEWEDSKDRNRGKGMKFVVEKKITIQEPGSDKQVGGVLIKLDPKQKPKAIDLWALEPGMSEEAAAKEKPVIGIYELEGDTLKVSWVPLEKRERPLKFPTKPGPGEAVVVLKRKPAKTK